MVRDRSKYYGINQPTKVCPYHINVKQLMIFSAIMLTCLTVFANERQFTYNVTFGGNKIGELHLTQKFVGSDVFLKMKSDVQARFVFAYNIKTNDHCYFSNGKLIYSNVYRSVNNKERDNKRTRLANDHYVLESPTVNSRLKLPIRYNMMLLYCQEPVNIWKVYSDSFQQFLAIRKIGDHHYKINLPDGNSAEYHFADGICQRVIIQQSLYTIRMTLSNLLQPN
ncbi:MAG TPA: DUF6134 family protein [Pedobacter sp.]|jgi:hypothetical protein